MKTEKLPSGSYRARKTYKGKTYTIVLPYKPTDKELTILFAEKLQEADNPNCSDGSFLYYANKYIASRSNVVSPATTRTYNIKINQLSDHFKALNIHDITQDDVQVEINLFSQDHATKTAKTLHGFIASVLNTYRPNLRLHTTFCAQPKKDEYEPNTKEIKKILEHVKGTRYSIPFQLGVLGCRRGEICALNLSDLKGNELHIHRSYVYNKEWILKDTPKNESSNRCIILPDSLVKEINEAGTIYDGHPNALNKAIHKCQKDLGIQSFKFHCLRSYFASYAHTLGIPDKDIMSIGGWKTDAVMKTIYRREMEESRKKSMSKITKKILP